MASSEALAASSRKHRGTNLTSCLRSPCRASACVSVIWAQTLQDDLTYSSLIYTVMTSGSSIREMVSTIGYGNVEEEGQDVKYNSEMLQLRCGAGGAETMFGHVLVVRNANLLTYLYYFCEREAPFRRMMVLTARTTYTVCTVEINICSVRSACVSAGVHR